MTFCLLKHCFPKGISSQNVKIFFGPTGPKISITPPLIERPTPNKGGGNTIRGGNTIKNTPDSTPPPSAGTKNK